MNFTPISSVIKHTASDTTVVITPKNKYSIISLCFLYNSIIFFIFSFYFKGCTPYYCGVPPLHPIIAGLHPCTLLLRGSAPAPRPLFEKRGAKTFIRGFILFFMVTVSASP
jgi:hypothetical protein